MSRTITRRVLAQPPSKVFTEITTTPLRCLRPFSSTPRRRADKDEAGSAAVSPATPPQAQHTPLPASSISNQSFKSPSLHPKADISSNPMGRLADILKQNQNQRNRPMRGYDAFASSDGSMSLMPGSDAEADPHHFHIYATRHNTHITVTRPNRSPLISVSAGNLGFRKAGRKHYDSAFQLAGYVFGRMKESGLNAEIQRMEVVLRGFGQGREAVTKALLGSEGRFLRSKVVKVADATRLKFGGTRSKKPRRLG